MWDPTAKAMGEDDPQQFDPVDQVERREQAPTLAPSRPLIGSYP